MMCPVIGVKKGQAQPFALDLGIGMQLTNICRDVLEDAQNDRFYLPEEELCLRGLTKVQLKEQGSHARTIEARLVSDYLDLADDYYASGEKGFAYIPFRPRLAIMVAGKVYQAIGHKIRKNDFNVLTGRCYLNNWEKVLVSLRALSGIFRPRFWFHGHHQSSLHHSLLGLPGIDSKQGSGA